MRILVTGGYGYIGGHLVSKLIADGHDVCTFDTMFNARDWGFRNVPGINASVCNLDAVQRAMDGVSVVYHLAARMDYANNLRHPIRIYNTNVLGTVQVLTAANFAGVDNVIFTSSAAVYGDVVGAEEFGPVHPVNLYGCSKLAAETVCQHYINIGMNVKILRLFNVWGGRFSQSVVGKFLNGSRAIYGDGTQTRDFVHVDDVVDALIRAQSWDPSIYNIGSGEEVTIRGLYDILAGGEPAYANPPCEEIQRSCADMELTFERTSWRPTSLLSEMQRDQVLEHCCMEG